jgi:hypothetical protein
MKTLHLETVSTLLWHSLNKLMNLELLNNFRIVGGTSLSLQMGHRVSVDIDLFTDMSYDSFNFNLLDEEIKKLFNYVEKGHGGNNSMGQTYYVGDDPNNQLKLDFYYTDTFHFPIVLLENIRLASIEEIATMKLDVIGKSGRKKDFWDLHEIMNVYTLDELIKFYENKYPFNHSRQELIHGLTNFEKANNDFDPICLKGKHWELIQFDIEEKVRRELANE